MMMQELNNIHITKLMKPTQPIAHKTLIMS